MKQPFDSFAFCFFYYLINTVSKINAILIKNIII